jgi:predicted porin
VHRNPLTTLPLLPLLAALLAAAPAARAGDGEITLYGTLLPLVDVAAIQGPTAAGLTPATGGATQVSASAYSGLEARARARVGFGTSNFGFKAATDLLGDDLRVFVQLETQINPDGDPNPPSVWANRNSALGLEGKFGRVMVGNWDTPYKFPILTAGAIRGLNSFDNALIASPGFNVPGTTTQSTRVAGKADAAFNRRQGNSIQYWTPEVAGFSARLMYSVDESTTSIAGLTLRPAVYSGLVSYVNGPLTVRYAYERHQDYFGLSQLGGTAYPTAGTGGVPVGATGSTDQGHLLFVQFTLPTRTTVSGMGEWLSYANDGEAAGVHSFSRGAYYVLVQQRIDQHQLFASFGQAAAGSCETQDGSFCSTNGLGARQLTAGYTYSIGRSFDVFAAYYQMDNSRSAQYALVGGPGTVPAGGTTRGFGVGMLYTFSATAATPKLN